MNYPWKTEGQEEMKKPLPPMPGNRMWYIWAPLVIKLAISFAVSTAAVAGYSFYYISRHREEAAQAVRGQQEMLDFSMMISEKVMQYTTQIEAVTAVIVIAALLVMFVRDRKTEKLYGVLPARKAPIWKYGAVLGIAAGMCVGLNNMILVGNLSAYSSSYEQTAESLYSAPFAVQIVSLGILVPISEELIFRGLMFKRIRQQAGFLRAALYSTLAFTILHGNLVQMLYAFATGMMLCYVYEKYGSVKAPMAAHIVMNLIAVAATQYRLFDWMLQDKMRVSLITVACSALAASMFVLIQRIDEKGAPSEGETEDPEE